MNNAILKYKSDSRVTENHFVISEVNREFLDHYGITDTIEDFKERVRKSTRYFEVTTGNEKYAFQRTRVYNIKDFINKNKEVQVNE